MIMGRTIERGCGVKILLIACGLALVFVISGCGPTVTVKHEVAPIYMTIDINIKVQKELEDFFAFEESRDKEVGADKTKTM